MRGKSEGRVIAAPFREAMAERCCVIRDGREGYVLRQHLTAEELADVQEREKSAAARRRFGARLRQARKLEDAADNAEILAAAAQGERWTLSVNTSR